MQSGLFVDVHMDSTFLNLEDIRLFQWLKWPSEVIYDPFLWANNTF